MGNSVVLIRQVADMTHLQPNLGETRRQQPRSTPFSLSSLFNSQLVKDGEEFLLKKGIPKTLRTLGPMKISPILVPTQLQKRLLQEVSYGDAPPQSFFSGRGTRITEATRSFPTSLQGQRVMKPLFQKTI